MMDDRPTHEFLYDNHPHEDMEAPLRATEETLEEPTEERKSVDFWSFLDWIE